MLLGFAIVTLRPGGASGLGAALLMETWCRLLVECQEWLLQLGCHQVFGA